MSKPANSSALLPIIILTVFLDMLGIGIIIPVIPTLFFETDSDFFAASVSNDTRSLLYGFLIAAYPLMQFFSAPLLGSLSDRHGRKPILSIALVGTLLGYLLFAYAIYQQNIILLFFSRMIPGFTGGNIAIIYSAISDISTAAEKTKNFGLVGAAFGIGFIVGPTIGGILADDTVVSWFNAATPFLFTAALTLINLVLVFIRFPETLKERNNRPLSIFTGVNNIITSFRSPRLRTIFSVVLLWALGFNFFTQFFSVLLIQKFGFAEKDIGLLFGWVGIWLAITQGVIVARLSRRFVPSRLITITLFTLASSIVMLLLPNMPFWFYIINPLIAISHGITSPNMTTIVSEQASADQQGQILGINQSMQSVGAIIPPMLGGYFNTLNPNLPLLSSACLIFCAWLVFVFIFRKREA